MAYDGVRFLRGVWCRGVVRRVVWLFVGYHIYVLDLYKYGFAWCVVMFCIGCGVVRFLRGVRYGFAMWFCDVLYGLAWCMVC